MPFLNVLRRRMFWFMDTLKGSPIKRHYQEIKCLIEQPTSKESVRTKELHLSRLIYHAVNTTPFYKNEIGYKSLQDFPIIDKNLILKNYEDFKSSLYKKKKLYKATSSGSTGIPFSILQDRGKRDRNIADVIYFSELAGSIFGDKLYFLKLWDHKNRKGRIVSWLQNIYAHNVMDTSADEMALLLDELVKDDSPKNILGYPSFFEVFCNYLDSFQHKPKIEGVNSIISFAEPLKQNQVSLISSLFGSPVYERYSNQENGIFAQKTIKNPDHFTLNLSSYHFEVLKINSNEHVKPGEVGRFVVTDLFNYAMPMIRYDTGDMVVYEEMISGHPYVSSIFGRRMDTIYNTKGKIISPHIFYMVLDFGKIKQYQFVQVDERAYLFRINGDKKNVGEDKIVAYFKKYLGEEASISFEYVDELPLLSSGKRKKVVNEYKKS